MDSITVANSRNTKEKRDAQAGSELPPWASRQLKALSTQTGISFKKLLASALGFGLYQLKEELGPIATLLSSAEQMARLDPNETPEAQRPPEKPIPAEATRDTAGTSGLGTDTGIAPTSVLEPGRNGALETQPPDAGERREELGTSDSGNAFVAELTGSVE